MKKQKMQNLFVRVMALIMVAALLMPVLSYIFA